LNTETIIWVRNLLNQGLHIGVEQADVRRCRANSWSDCGVIRITREAEAIDMLEQLLQKHQHLYVRLFSINPETRQRGSILIIQQPQEK
jgi:carbon dioxide concentrating mechanism protein CcmM